jgi:hypothetical protein
MRTYSILLHERKQNLSEVLGPKDRRNLCLIYLLRLDDRKKPRLEDRRKPEDDEKSLRCVLLNAE